jgi:hypothetical protein
MPECRGPEDCDDANDCTDDTCADGTCEYTSLADGTACDERNECTTGMCASGECDTTPVVDGTVCGNGAGTCQLGICSHVACTEQGIRDAIAAGGGPYTFDCADGTTVVTEAEIVIDNDVILNGEGKLTVDANLSHRVFSVAFRVTAELRGLTVTGGRLVAQTYGEEVSGAGILNEGRLLLVDTTVRDNSAEHLDECYTGEPGSCVAFGGGIYNHCTTGAQSGRLTLQSSTVSGNYADWLGGAIASAGHCASALLQNSTVSGNSAGVYPRDGINSTGTLMIVSSTISDRLNATASPVTITNSLVDGDCSEGVITGGHNIESPGNTCGFDQEGDQVNVSSDDLKLGPLQDNGGPTMTHALGAGSVAIDVIPDAACEVGEDQRGVERPQGDACDVGAFELEVGP